MRPLVTDIDVERAVIAILDVELPDYEPDVGIGVDLPSGWTTRSGNYLQVAWDATPEQFDPVGIHATIRLTAWSGSADDAKRVVSAACGLLCAWPGGDGIVSIRRLTGPFTARDEATRGQLASVTVRVTARSTPLEPAGS